MITTEYGSWYNYEGFSLTVESSVATSLSGGDPEWLDLLMETGAFEALVEGFRKEINDRLPEGVSLCGDQFIGPYYFRPEFDFSEILKEIDFWGMLAQVEEEFGISE